MAFCENQYFEKTGVLQKNLHQSEKKRLALERELFACSRSDKQTSQIKNAKLGRYLKEICEREKRAKARNLELLKDVKHVQLHMEAWSPDRTALHQKKVECWNRVTRHYRPMKPYEKARTAGIIHKDAMLSGLSSEDPSLHFTKGLHQPAPDFMGHQAAKIPAPEPWITKASVFQQPNALPNRAFLLSDQLASSLTKPSVSRKDATDVTCLSDAVAIGTDISTARNKSEGDQRISMTVPSAQPLTKMTSNPLKEMEQSSPHTTLKKVLNQASFGHPETQNHPPAANDVKVSSDTNVIAENVESISQKYPPPPECGAERRDPADVMKSSSARVASGCDESSVSTGRELSLSLGHAKDPVVLPENGDFAKPRSQKRSSIRGTAKRSNTPSPASQSLAQSQQDIATPQATAGGLSVEGFFHLLENIEGRLDQRGNALYRTSSISEEKLNNLISLCDGTAALNGEDLEACGAVVLHQLQRLSWSMSKGCLLPQEIVRTNWTTAEGKNIRSCLGSEEAVLWERWFKHALLLENSDVLNADEIVELFSPLLVEKNSSYIHETKVLLKALLKQASEASLSMESNESSCNLPSLLHDGVEIKPALAGHEVIGTGSGSGKPGLQSGEEDGHEESSVESIPIRETKAYQLLKQSAEQQTRPSSEEVDDGSDLDLDLDLSGVTPDENEKAGREKLWKTNLSSRPGGLGVWTENTAKKTGSAVKSKAFWGESDDSSDDIEAALRPPPRSANSDDFYD